MRTAKYATLLSLGLVLLMGMNVFAQGDLQGSVKISPAYGIQVALIDAEGEIVDETTTDADGNYNFSDVSEGNYKLKFMGEHINIKTTEYFSVSADGEYREPDQLTYNTPGLITALYLSATSSPDEFPQMVKENRNAIGSDKQFFKKIDQIAAKLIQEGANMPSQNERMERLYDIGSRNGVPPEITQKMENDQQFNPGIMGLMLAQMSPSIKQILAGDINKYHNSQLYLLAKQSVEMMDQLKKVAEMSGFDLSEYMDTFRVIGFYYTLNFIKILYN